MPDADELIAQADDLWSQLWRQFYGVREDRWEGQTARLREMARLCMALVEICNQISEEEKR